MSKKLALLPPKTAWLSAIFLYGVLQGYTALFAMLLPFLTELYQQSPRLAFLCVGLLVFSPIVLVAIVHHLTSGLLDRAESVSAPSTSRGLLPSVVSWWAGVHGWFVLYTSSTVTSLVLIIAFPPEPDSLRSLLAAAGTYASGGAIASVQTAVWILVAAQLYNLERAARKRD